MPRRCRGGAAAMPRRCRGGAAAMPRRGRADAAKVPQRCREGAAEVPRCCGPAEVPRRGRGDAARVPRQCRGDAAEVATLYLGKHSRSLRRHMNGAPLTRTPPRRSWGRGPSPSGVAANPGPSVDVSSTASCAAPTGRDSSPAAWSFDVLHANQAPPPLSTLKPTSTFKRAVYHA